MSFAREEPAKAGDGNARLELGADGVLRASGDWIVARLTDADASIRSLLAEKPSVSALDVSGIGRYDTAGAWLIHRASTAVGAGRELSGAEPQLLHLIEEISKHDRPVPPRPVRENAILAAVTRLGASVARGFREALAMVAFVGLIVESQIDAFFNPRKLRVVSIVHHIETTGLDALPIVALITFLVGAVIAFLSSDILSAYGGAVFSVDLISVAFFREFAVLLTAIMVAGRSGSAFTAEIGAMKSHDEIDAMRALGLDPIQLLVTPRVIALLVTVPILTFVGDVMGLLGGAVAVWSTLDMTLAQFTNRLLTIAKLKHVWVGLIKAPFFAFLIATIGCYQGFKVTGSAESVGSRTTLSVVQAIFVVIIVDALFAVFFQKIHY